MPPVINVNLDMPVDICNSSVEYILEISVPSDESSNSTKSGYELSADHVGAMWFTVAVVLVYGVGTIGLLGITARRNRATVLMDKEVNAYLKSKFSDGGWAHSGRKRMRVRRPVYELVRTSDPDDQRGKLVWELKSIQETNVYESTSFYRKPKPKLIRAKTWAGVLTSSFSETKNNEAESLRSFGPLPAISECCDNNSLSNPDICAIQEEDKLVEPSENLSFVAVERSSPLKDIKYARASFT